MAGAVACSPRARIGVEAVLAETGLPEALFDQAKHEADLSVSVTVAEQAALVAQLEKGELDAILANGDLAIDALLRKGAAVSAEPILHGEVVLVGPKPDPAGIHQQRTFPNAMRALIEGDAAFFRCVGCGVRAREDAIFTTLAGNVPKRGHSFLDVGQKEEDVLKAMRQTPGYALLSRPTVLHAMKNKEWSFKPMWSSDVLQVDVYRWISRPPSKMESAQRAGVEGLGKFLTSEKARALIDTFGSDLAGQPLYRSGSPEPGQGFQPKK